MLNVAFQVLHPAHAHAHTHPHSRLRGLTHVHRSGAEDGRFPEVTRIPSWRRYVCWWVWGVGVYGRRFQQSTPVLRRRSSLRMRRLDCLGAVTELNVIGWRRWWWKNASVLFPTIATIIAHYNVQDGSPRMQRSLQKEHRTGHSTRGRQQPPTSKLQTIIYP